MLNTINLTIGKTKYGDDIILRFIKITKEDRSPRFLDYTKYIYHIYNQSHVMMGLCEIDQNTTPDGEMYFDEGEIDTETYGFSQQGIISQTYQYLNNVIYCQYNTTLHSDITSMSHKMSLVREKFVRENKAIFLGYNNKGNTRFDSKSAPTPMFQMLPPK